MNARFPLCLLSFCFLLIAFLPGPSLAVAPSELADIQRELSRIPLEDMSPDLPLEAVPWMSAFNQALRTRVEEILQTQSPEHAPEQVAEALETGLREGGVRFLSSLEPRPDEEATDEASPLGLLEGVAVRRPASYSPYLFVTVAYSVPCGTHQSLYLFDVEDGHYLMRYALEPGLFTDVSAGREGLEAALTAPAADGSFLLIVVDNPPWCTSCWSVLRWNVVRLGAQGPGELLLHGEDSYYRCSEEPDDSSLIQVNHDGFSLHYPSSSVDMARLLETRVRRFVLEGRTLKEIPAAGMSATAALSVWLAQPWETARSAVAEESREWIEQWHEILSAASCIEVESNRRRLIHRQQRRITLGLCAEPSSLTSVTITLEVGGRDFRVVKVEAVMTEPH